MHTSVFAGTDSMTCRFTWGKLRAVVAPAVGLNTAYRDHDFPFGRHQHIGVEDAVLLGPHQFLPVHQEHHFLQIVLHAQFRHTPAGADLGDLHGRERGLIE